MCTSKQALFTIAFFLWGSGAAHARGQVANCYNAADPISAYKGQVEAALLLSGDEAVPRELIQVALVSGGHVAEFQIRTPKGQIVRTGTCDDDGDAGGQCGCTFNP